MFSEKRTNELMDALHKGGYDDVLVKDVILVVENDEPTYSTICAIVENLQKHEARGEWDDVKVINSYAHAGEVALKGYLAILHDYTPWHKFTDMATRVALGRELAFNSWKY